MYVCVFLCVSVCVCVCLCRVRDLLSPSLVFSHLLSPTRALAASRNASSPRHTRHRRKAVCMGSAVRGRDDGDDGERVGDGRTPLVRCWCVVTRASLVRRGRGRGRHSDRDRDGRAACTSVGREGERRGEKGREGERRGEKGREGERRGCPPTARCPLSHTTAESTTAESTTADGTDGTPRSFRSFRVRSMPFHSSVCITSGRADGIAHCPLHIAHCPLPIAHCPLR